jgi:hypothetical protein
LRLHGTLLDRRERAAGTAELPHEHARPQLFEALAMALEPREDGRHLETEGQRYGLLQIAAADHRCVAIAARQFRQ